MDGCHSDRIQLHRIAAESVIGILGEEQSQSQQLFISAVLHTDFSAVQKSDSLEDSIDYAEVVHSIRAFAAGNPSKMLEHFAHHLALHIKATFNCPAVEITVEKPRYAPQLDLDAVVVKVRR